MNYKIRTMKKMVYDAKHVLPYYEHGFFVSIEDEGAGEFVKIVRGEHEMLNIDAGEWKELRKVIDQMIRECWE